MWEIPLNILPSKYPAFTIARLALRVGSLVAPSVVAFSLFTFHMRLLRDKTPRKDRIGASLDCH